MEKSDQQIFEEFSSQLCEWVKSGTLPALGNHDICYGLELQKERLEKYHMKIEYEMIPQYGKENRISTFVFSDIYYTNKFLMKSYHKKVNYFINGKKGLTLKDNESLYTIITWLKDSTKKANYCCPNCGAFSDVSTLLKGCPYCQTQFIMSDLFPKVTNYYFLRAYGLSEEESNKKTFVWMASGALIGFLIRLPGLLIDILQGGNLLFLLFLALLTSGCCAVFGYFALSLSLFFRVLIDFFKQAPRSIGQMKAKKQLTDFMKQFDPGFTFEYFFGKVQSLVKILIFTDNRYDLSIYEGKPIDNKCFDDIIDSQFEGAISVNGGRVEGNYCYLDLNVYMTDVYFKGDKLRKQSDRFRINLCRNISRPVDYGFSLTAVTCKNCGGSFDATRKRFCPYCKSQYDLKDDDWIIKDIKKI